MWEQGAPTKLFLTYIMSNFRRYALGVNVAKQIGGQFAGMIDKESSEMDAMVQVRHVLASCEPFCCKHVYCERVYGTHVYGFIAHMCMARNILAFL